MHVIRDYIGLHGSRIAVLPEGKFSNVVLLDSLIDVFQGGA